ncbi:hypothetical protein EX30DRAFT_339228 [Ascodesmis nigricans]|uniref:RAVE subunit 2/Rogdi n=1 Tax=Ascodesmis nigricans TaxID=341454 RepID=A0A4S2N1H1_9PEZI|nr:hypothetical protein EX30DRAFT_339228 [Ascodesmis nigricans]
MTDDELEKATASRELTWLLTTLTDTLQSVRTGLQECLTLLDPSGPSSTLALSSSRSEALKGIIHRSGSSITRGDIQLKLYGLPYSRGGYKLCLAGADKAATGDAEELVLEQLVDVRNCVVTSLDLVGGLGSRGNEKKKEGGGTHVPGDAANVLRRLRELKENVGAAKAALKGQSAHRLWPYYGADPKIFDPPLPQSLAFDLYISEAAIVVEVRSIEHIPDASDPSSSKGAFSAVQSLGTSISSPFGFRERFAAAVGFSGHPGYHETQAGVGEVFDYQGERVKVKDSVKVESQDPSLMAVWAKLGGVEHVLSGAVKSLEVVMTAAGIKC